MLYYLYCSLHTKWVWVLYQNYRLRINFPLLTWKITAKFSYSQLTKINISPLQYHVVNAPTFVELFKIKIHSLERECKHLDSANFNPIHDGHFRGCSMMGGGKKAPPLPKICHTYPTMMKLGTVIPYPKKIQKIYESRDTPLEFCWHQHFFTGNQQVLLYQEIQI